MATHPHSALGPFEAWRVPCTYCGAGFVHGELRRDGFVSNCVKLDMATVREYRRKGKALPEAGNLHRERSQLALQWKGAGRPPIAGALGVILFAIAARSRR